MPSYFKKDRLIVFSRFPEAGATKTRLIPTLGAQGAADLQRAMTEHTLRWATTLTPEIDVCVCYTGADETKMQQWLGSKVTYRRQRSGDLGERMMAAFSESFVEGALRVVAIGIDCPGLGPDHVREALEALTSCDVVLGPAVDGGYYLIGLKSMEPELFGAEIVWGSEQVCRQTKAIVDRRDLSLVELEPLADVDLPEDLGIWQRLHHQESQ